MPKMVIRVNQNIKTGELLAKAKDHNTQNIHSAVGGVVKNFRTFRYAGNYNDIKAVEIAFGGHLNTFSAIPNVVIEQMHINNIFSRIIYAGIFDSGFGSIDPVFSQLLSQGVDALVINAVEYLPFVTLEEKILSLHSEKIVESIRILQHLFGLKFDKQSTSDKKNKPTIVCSNSSSNRRALLKAIRKSMGKNHEVIIKSIRLAVDTFEDLVLKNNALIFKSLFDEKQGSVKQYKSVRPQNTLIIRPSTLLAIYDAVICEKPFIEKYMQLIVGEKKSFLIKAPLGLPLFNLIMQSKKMPQKAEHFFMGDFINREVLFNFVTPVSKHFSHLFMLTDESFSDMYKTISKYQSHHGKT